MEPARLDRLAQRAMALVAVAFGALTLFAGGRALGGADPGYAVFKPLLIYNFLMGAAYIAAGVMAWRKLSAGWLAAGIIFVLNALVLGAIAYLYRTGAAVAVESLRAMSLRTVVWLLLFAGLTWLRRRAGARALERP